MSRITSSVGLVTGVPIEETVKQLMAVAARPKDLLAARNKALEQEQAALDTLGSKLLAFQFAVNKLKQSSIFDSREVASSDDEVLSASIPTGTTPTPGAFQVRPVKLASAQQLLSQAFGADSADFGEGTFSFGFGGFLDKGIALEQLNGGAGVPRGKVRITDRNGDSAVIDLTFARTVDDVLDAINSNATIAVSAATDGDSFTLTDASGGTGNLTVGEVGVGTTAAALGLAGISVADNQAIGADVFALGAATKLTSLRDGNGVQITKEGVVDLVVTLADGTSLAIDLHDAETLGDVLAQINAASPSKLSAAIAGGGNRLLLTDLTSGGGAFSVANGAASTAASDLGIAGSGVGGTLTGGRVVSGPRDTLLSSLRGGRGVGPLGTISITDRAGVTANVNLAAAETLDDVIDLINGAAPEVTASINAARNGLVIRDDSGGSGNLVIADADATDAATALGLAINQAAATVNSGALKRRTLSEATLLSSLNGGQGVKLGDIQIIDSNGVTKSADLNGVGNEAETVGDVLTAINALANGVEARINDAGDGILLVDTAGGTRTLGVKDLSGDIAKSLNLTRPSKTVEIDGVDRQVVDGARSFAIDLSDLDFSSDAVPLASLNGGKGVAAGDVEIKDAAGKALVLDLNGADAAITTVGQLVEAINRKADAFGVGVTAAINDSGTGILLENTAAGSGTLTVRDVNSSAAADLKILGPARTVAGVQTIDGVGAFTSASGAQTGLDALAERINQLNAGVTASTVFDGSGYRLSLAVDATGAANELLVDAGESTLAFEEVAKAQDALLLYGNLTSTTGGVLLNSATNLFEGSVGGVDLTVEAASETPVTVTVKSTDKPFVDAMDDLVEAYNSLRGDLGKLTAFDAESATTGLLFGTREALQIDVQMSRVLTDRYAGLGDLQSLAEVGLSVDESGELVLDKAKLSEAYESDAAAVEEFFTNKTSGVAVKISNAIDKLAGADKSLLVSRSESIQAKVKANQDRIDRFTLQLERQQDRIFLQFYQLEQIVAKLQQSQAALHALQVVPPLGTRS